MTKTVTVSVAKAMKLKNRLVGRLAEVQSEIASYNSQPIEQPRPFDIRKKITERESLVAAVIETKLAISRANSGKIDADIYTLGELKSEVAFYAGLSTTDGTVANDYHAGSTVWNAEVKKPEVIATKRRLEARIDELQDTIDEFNATTKIMLSASAIQLATSE